MKWLAPVITVFTLAAACAPAPTADEAREKLPASALISGYEFLQADTQALQDDDFANPGFLWVDRGRALFATAPQQSKACSACHGEDGAELKGAAAHYPSMDKTTGKLTNIEGRINLCRTRHQGLEPLDYETDDLLSLTAFVSHLSRGEPVKVDVSGPAEVWYRRGEDYFFTRRGQYNLACNQCHNDNWGRQLRGDTISQGHGTAFPGYRFEWQSLGSLQRRLRDCDAGVRAEPLAYGSDDYLAVELYLAKRAEGLPIEVPGVRR